MKKILVLALAVFLIAGSVLSADLMGISHLKKVSDTSYAILFDGKTDTLLFVADTTGEKIKLYSLGNDNLDTIYLTDVLTVQNIRVEAIWAVGSDVSIDAPLNITEGPITVSDKDLVGVERLEADTIYIGAVNADSVAVTKKYVENGFQPLEATLTDIADGTIAENLVNTAYPWADNEVADDITINEADRADSLGVSTAYAYVKSDTLVYYDGTNTLKFYHDGTDWVIDGGGSGEYAMAEVAGDTIRFVDGESDTTLVFFDDNLGNVRLQTGIEDQSFSVYLDSLIGPTTLYFYDVTTGVKTLAELAAGGGSGTTDSAYINDGVQYGPFTNDMYKIKEGAGVDITREDSTDYDVFLFAATLGTEIVSGEITNGTIEPIDLNQSSKFNFNGGIYKNDSTIADSQYVSKKYVDDASGGLTDQSVKGNHVDSTAEDFVFVNPYKGTSAVGDSVLATRKEIGDSTTAVRGDIPTNYLTDNASDVMTGTLTADGLTLGANENITLGAQTIDHDGTNFVFNDKIDVDSITNSGGTLALGDAGMAEADSLKVDSLAIISGFLLSADWITDLAGTNLSVTAGVLNAAAGNPTLEQVFNYMDHDIFDTTGFNDSIGIEDASPTVKGIASFNADDFDVAAGVVTIDNTNFTMDDLVNGATNAAITLTQETNFETAYTRTGDFDSNYVTLTATTLTSGGTFVMPVVTTGRILVADGADYEEVEMSGDATIIANGTVTIAIDVIDSTKVVAGSLSMSGDLHTFTEAELYGRLSDVTDFLQLVDTAAAVADASPAIVTGNAIFDFVVARDHDTADVVRGEIRDTIKADTLHFAFNLFDPDAIYTEDHEVCIVPRTRGAITIRRIDVTLDADPTTELTYSIKFADAFIGFANATVIDDTATVAGVTTVTGGFGDATVPANKCIYFLFDADPDDAITQACGQISYTRD